MFPSQLSKSPNVRIKKNSIRTPCIGLTDDHSPPLVNIKRSKNGKQGMIYRYSFPINPRQDPCIPLSRPRDQVTVCRIPSGCVPLSKYCNAGLWQHHLSLDTEQGSGNPAFTEICLKTKKETAKKFNCQAQGQTSKSKSRLGPGLGIVMA